MNENESGLVEGSAKAFYDWVGSEYSYVSKLMIETLRPCWDAAWTASQNQDGRKSTSSNKQRMPCVAYKKCNSDDKHPGCSGVPVCYHS
jgi:hypothetical protein